MTTKSATFTLRLPSATLVALKAASARKDVTASIYALEAIQAAIKADAPKVAGMNLNTSKASAQTLGRMVDLMPAGTDVIGWLLANQGPSIEP
jgi:hypothetical protein